MTETGQWDFFPYLPVTLQDSSTKELLMIRYMTREGVDRSKGVCHLGERTCFSQPLEEGSG